LAETGDHQGGDMMLMGKNCKNTNLAIINLALLATVLMRDAYGVPAFFRKSRFINEKTAVFLAAGQLIGVSTMLINDSLFLPWRCGKKMLVRLIVGVWNHFGHTSHVFLLGLKQAFEILFRSWAYITSFRFEQPPVIVKECSKFFCRPPKRAVGMTKFSFSCLDVPAGCWCLARLPIDLSFSWGV
jgi:hypothetical protein